MRAACYRSNGLSCESYGGYLAVLGVGLPITRSSSAREIRIRRTSVLDVVP